MSRPWFVVTVEIFTVPYKHVTQVLFIEMQHSYLVSKCQLPS